MFLPALAAQTFAAEPLTLTQDHSQVLTLNRSPAIVVVGNPSIAEATIQGNFLFLHGRGFGSTNIMIFDDQGKQLANYEVDVTSGSDNTVTMIKAAQLNTYVCPVGRDCESIMHPGDSYDYFKSQAKQPNEDKINLATGQKSADAKEPPPAQ
ncbi:pilus assembly protein N-terminal domain-containing protein [Aestuariivirga sp.]|uniref:pilus assembly protein N-terminal domain-containing protein n=1 Tax=Aestuariivirga sp. TaxID=2650926 RepID=UPI0039E530D5